MNLENNYVRVTFHPETGGFASLYDKKTSFEYIAAPERAMPFRLMTPLGERAWLHEDARGADIEIAGATARVRYTIAGIEAEAVYVLDGPAILATLRVANHGERTIEEVMFPMARGIAAIPEGEIIWPMFFRRNLGDPFQTDTEQGRGAPFGSDHHTWNEWTQKQHMRYPQHLCSAWCDYGNRAHGLGMEGCHTDFSIMDFFFHKVVEKTRAPVRRTLDMIISHPRRVRPGETYTSSPVRITLHEGDWRAVAGAHRDWLETWVRKPNRPRAFAESIGWHFFFLKHQDGWESHTYEELPRLAEAALAAGCRYLMLFGWQTGGHDNNYWYRYAPNEDWGGEAALRRAVEQCRAMGVELIPFFNGTLANVEMPEHKSFGYKWEAKTRSGHPYYAGDWARCNFDVPMRNRAMLHHEICFCEEQQAYFLETVARIAQRYGFGNLQLDQISEKALLCYDDAHGHVTPDRAPIDGLAALLPKTRALVREVNPEGVMISECLNDFTGQWCDSSWDWTALLPFPDPVLYTLPWLMGSLEIDALEYGEVNQAFAYKLHLDMKIDGGDGLITQYPDFTAHVRRNAELRRRVAEYYALGDYRAQDGAAIQASDNVLVTVFHNRAAHKAAIVAAECAGRAGAAEIAHEWQTSALEVRLDSNMRAARTVSPNEPLNLSLERYEIVVICLDLAD